ncbi:hypothetical protein GCM10009544_44270 [Streptomyces stramineus]|uniref:Uncharacterized protein n=1 Tax=Streptomyces stramineus TaxID=173861 RepID=A0ABN1AIP1_9ACTN
MRGGGLPEPPHAAAAVSFPAAMTAAAPSLPGRPPPPNGTIAFPARQRLPLEPAAAPQGKARVSAPVALGGTPPLMTWKKGVTTRPT